MPYLRFWQRRWQKGSVGPSRRPPCEGGRLPELKIGMIGPSMRGISLTARVVLKGDRREVETKFGPAAVSYVILEDETGSIRLNLWRSQIEVVKAGDAVRLTNAFVKIYGSQMELNLGSDGRIEVLERGQ